MLDYDKIREQLKSGQKIIVPKGTTAIGSVQKTTPQKVHTQTDMNASKGGSNPLGAKGNEWNIGKLFETADVAGEGLKVGVQLGAKGVATFAAGIGTAVKNWDYETLNPARQDRELTFGTYDREEYLKRQAARDAQKEVDMDKASAYIETLPVVGSADENATAFAQRLEGKDGFTRTVGEVAQGVGGMLPGLAASVINPGAGLAVMAASAGGNAMEEAREQGASFEEAYTYGVLTGAKEAATEKMFGGLKFVGDGFVSKLPGISRVTGAVGDSAQKLIAKNADTIVGKFMANSATRAIINTAKDATGEGMEEFVSGLVDPYLRRMTFDPNASSAELSDLVNQALIGGLTAVVMNGVTSTAALPGKVKGTRDYNEAVRKQVEDLNELASVIPADIRPEPMKVSSHTTQEEVDSYKAEVGRIMQENTDRIAKEAAMVSEIGAEDSVGSLEDAVSRDESSARVMYGDFAVDQYNAQRENMIHNGYTEDAARPVTEAELDNTVLAEEAMMKYQKAVDLAKTVFGTEDLSLAQKEQFKNQYNVDFDALRTVVDEETANLELSPATRFRKVLESDFETARRVYGADVVDRYMAMQGTNRTGANSIFTVNGRNVTRFEALAEMRKRYPQATEEALIAMYNEAYAELVAEERKADPEKFKKLEDYEKTANIRLKKCGLKLEVRWDMNNTEEAYYDKATQTIVLNGNIIHKPSVASFITAHELAHYAVANDPAFLQDIRVAAKAIGYDLEAGKERRRGPYAEAELDEEAVADFIAQMTTDASIIEQLTKTRPSLLERIITYLKETLTLHKHNRVARAQKREVVRRLNKALEGKPVPPTVEQKVEQAVQRQVAEETKNVAPKATEVEPLEAWDIKRELIKTATTLESAHRIMLENSKLTRSGIANNLNAAVQMIEMGEEQAARDVIENLAYELNGGDLKHKQTAGVKVEEASSLRKDLKNVTLHVTPEMRSEWPDYGEFRKNAAKIVKLSTKGGREGDTVYAELRELYPWLPDVSNPADQVNTMITMASVNEEIPGLSEEQMADVQKLTDEIMFILHELTGVEVKSESVGMEEIPFSKSPVKYSPATYDQTVQTMYIGIKKGNLATPTDDQASVNTPKASRGTASTNSVTQVGSESNMKKSLSPTNSWGDKLSPAQQRYFKDSKVTDANGSLLPVYHGTMSDFYVFDRTKGNKEGNMGAGFYFTDNEEDVWRNYANIDGPDLQNKIEQMAQRLIDYEDMPEEAAYAQARERWMTRTEPRLIEAYVNITKPVVVGGEHSTFFDFDSGEVYDEETDSYDYGEPSGLLVDFLYALENVLEDYDVYKPDWDPFVSDLYYEAMDDGGISAYDLTQMVRFRLTEVYDMETGDMAIGEVMRQAFEDMGFDGIIDHTVSSKFPGMRLDQDTTHYIAFFPEQAKEIDNLNPTSNADIRYSKSMSYTVLDKNYMDAVQKGDMKEAQKLVDEAAKKAFPNSKLIQDGEFFKMWHHTDKEFTSFLPGTSPSSGGLKGIYFTPQEYGSTARLGNNHGRYYLNVENMKFAFGVEKDRMYVNQLRELQKGVTDREELARINRQFREETGIDAFFDWQNGWYNVLSPELIKSADPVTYDDKGGAIPLSERFDLSTSDIRYSKSPAVSEEEIMRLRAKVSSIHDELVTADEVTAKKLSTQLLKAQTDLDTLIEEERKATVKTPISTILQNLGLYRRSDLESLAEQISDGAWDDYEELSRDELEDGIRSIIEERAYTPLELQAPRYGYWVRPVEEGSSIRYSKEIDWDRMNQLWEKYQQEYGVKPRSGEVPEQINQDTRVSDFMESAYMAADGNEEMQARLKSRIVTGEGSYVPMTDKRAMANAERKISRGFSSALEGWQNSVAGSKALGKDDIALGELLLKSAMDSGDLVTAEKMVADLCVEATRAGQVLQAFSLLNKLSAEGRVYYIKQNVKKLQMDLEDRRGDKAPKLTPDQELLEKLSKATTLEEADSLQEEIIKDLALQVPPTMEDRVVSWRYLAMLGNARTHIRNIASNLFMLSATRVKDAVGGVVEGAVGNTVAPGMERTKTLKPASAATKQFAADQWLQVKNQMAMGGKHGFDDVIRKYRKSFGNSPAGAFLNKLNEVNSGTLEREDTFFKEKAFRHALATYMTANNLTPEFLTSGTQAANARLAQAKAYATKEAMRAVFQESSFVASKLNEIERKNAVTKLIVGGMLPFKKTPINVLKRGVDYTPIGMISGIASALNDSSTGAEAIDKICCGLTGSGMVLLGVWMASLGMVRAGGDADEKNREKYYNQMLGQQDYAITVGDTTYTVDWITPLSMPFMAGVEFYNASRNVNEDETELEMLHRLAGALVKSADPLTQLSMLSGLNDALSSYGDEGALSELVTSAGESYVTQFFPTLGGQIGRTVDNTRRTTYVPNNEPFRELQVLGKKIQNKTFPSGLSIGDKQILEPLEPYVDQWGRAESYGDNPFTRMFNQMAAPWYAKRVNRTAVDDELTQLYERAGESTVLPSPPDQYYDDLSGKRRYVSPKDYTEMQESAGQLKYNALASLIKSSAYQKMDDETRVSTIEDIYKYANNAAKADWAEKNEIEVKVDSLVGKIDSIVDTGVDVGTAFAIREQLSAISGEDTKDKCIALLNSYTNLTGAQKRALLLSAHSNYKNLPW